MLIAVFLILTPNSSLLSPISPVCIMRIFLAFCGVILIVSVLGCGNKVQVTGKVTFPDGAPLNTGNVIFDDGREQAKGAISEDGTYRLSSMNPNDGIKPGEYKVYITNAFSLGGAPVSATSVPKPTNLIDTKFTSSATSGLQCQVKGNTVFNIEVTKPE